MKYSDAEALPPCEFSAHCLRLLDDLDTPGDKRASEQVLSTDAHDMQDEYLIEKLRVHVPGCPICSAKLASARLLRSQQRVALRSYLADAESRVPSTTDRILSMLRQPLPGDEEMEQPSARQKRQSYILPEVFVPFILPKGKTDGQVNYVSDRQTASANSANHWVRNGFALATAAAVILAALGVFSHFVFHNGPGLLTSQREAKAWPSVIIGVSLVSSLQVISKFYNVDTTNGEKEQMTPTGMAAQSVEYETVSPDGKDVLYHFSNAGQTIYSTLQMEKSGAYVTSTPDGGVNNAIWMDNNHVLVAFAHRGAEEYDIQTGRTVQQFASLNNIYLLFYHAPYLYYQDAQQTVIDRSNLVTGEEQQLLANAGGLYFSHCVVEPQSVIIYCEARSDRFSRFGSYLYMVGGSGSGAQALSRQGTLLGFAPDHTLLYLQLQATLNSYQVVKLGHTPQQDRVVMKNAAPATAIVEPGDAMLAPDGHGLIVQDGNLADPERGVWYDDLTTQTSHELFTYTPGSYGRLIGWDQLRVNATTPAQGNAVPQTQVLAAA